MTTASVPEAIAGFLLVFFVPGYALAKAVFPEWRIRGAAALRRLVEVVTLAFVLSVVLTVLVGYGLLVATPAGFQAYWSDPVLEAVLAGVAAVAFAAAWARGAFRRTPPVPARPIEGPSEEGARELTEYLAGLEREARRVRHQLRTGVSDPAERDRLNARLEEIRLESRRAAERREALYAQ